jgi:ATP-dependent RNA helicase RhlB
MDSVEATSQTTPWVFSQLALNPKTLAVLEKIGFAECTPIQAQTLPHTLAGKDLIGRAQTGTGKTAAFLLTILERFVSNPIPIQERFSGEPRALVVAPTRELALQIEKDARQLSQGSRLNIMSVIGGTQLDKARARLREEAIDLLIATPGRLIDHLSSRDVYLDQIEVLVLDEADRMLDMGFIPDVKRIVNATPKSRQTLLFSATFSQDIINLAQRWTNSPIEIMLAVEQGPSKSVEQRVYMVQGDQKLKVLLNLLGDSEARRVIVFCNRRDETRKLSDALTRGKISNSVISGELPQQKRVRTLELFREGQFKVLVATDVAGRGLHIEGVTHVVNFNLPDDPEDYVHRIGRTGRAGETGISISFACEDDAFLIPELEAYLGHKLDLTQPDEELLK